MNRPRSDALRWNTPAPPTPAPTDTPPPTNTPTLAAPTSTPTPAIQKFKDIIDIQLVAFPQLGLADNSEAVEMMWQAMEQGCDLVAVLRYTAYLTTSE